MKSAPGLLTLISLAFPCQICLATILYVPGGTENVASTKMTKSLAVNGSIDDDGDVESETGGDTKTGSKTNGARSEGTRKSLEAMFDSMAPIKKKINVPGVMMIPVMMMMMMMMVETNGDVVVAEGEVVTIQSLRQGLALTFLNTFCVQLLPQKIKYVAF